MSAPARLRGSEASPFHCPRLGDQIVYQHGGWLCLFDTSTEKTRQLEIEVDGDSNEARAHWAPTAKLIDSADLSPDGKRAVLTARGDVYTVPAEHGATRNLTQTPGIREQNVAWSPDGRWIAYESDATGEQAIYIRPQDGMGPEQRDYDRRAGVSNACGVVAHSTKLAYTDSSLHLYYVDIHDRRSRCSWIDTKRFGWFTRQHYFAYRSKEVVAYVFKNPRVIYRMLHVETILMDALLKFAIIDLPTIGEKEALVKLRRTFNVQLHRFSEQFDLSQRSEELLRVATDALIGKMAADAASQLPKAA